MRTTTVLTASIMVAILALALPQADSNEEQAEHSVRNMLAHVGMYTSSDEKSFNRLGDASAVALTKVLAGNGISQSQVNQVLLIVRFSFEAPKIIEKPADRQPRTTLFLLKYLECSTADPDLRAKIAETRALLAGDQTF
jgi:hypothetical protein